MKLFALLFTAAALSGCVAYPYGPAPAYYGQGYYSPAGLYALPQPVAIYGSSAYRWWQPRLQPEGRANLPHVDRHDGRRDRDVDRDRARGRDRHADGSPHRRDRDRDGDGIPDRRDREGVGNRGDRSSGEGRRN